MEFVGDSHGCEYGDTHRVHGLRRLGDRSHFVIDVARQFLDVGFVQVSTQRIALTVDFHFHAICHSILPCWARLLSSVPRRMASTSSADFRAMRKNQAAAK